MLLGGAGYLIWSPSAERNRLNVIVLTVESFRADFIRPGVTPNLLAAARSGLRSCDLVSQDRGSGAAGTAPSQLVTVRRPPRHNVPSGPLRLGDLRPRKTGHLRLSESRERQASRSDSTRRRHCAVRSASLRTLAATSSPCR